MGWGQVPAQPSGPLNGILGGSVTKPVGEGTFALGAYRICSSTTKSPFCTSRHWRLLAANSDGARGAAAAAQLAAAVTTFSVPRPHRQRHRICSVRYRQRLLAGFLVRQAFSETQVSSLSSGLGRVAGSPWCLRVQGPHRQQAIGIACKRLDLIGDAAANVLVLRRLGQPAARVAGTKVLRKAAARSALRTLRPALWQPQRIDVASESLGSLPGAIAQSTVLDAVKGVVVGRSFASSQAASTDRSCRSLC